MYSNEKERLRIGIHDLIERVCHSCPLNISSSSNNENVNCFTCPTYLQLQEWGRMLTPNDLKHKQEKHIPYERFEELFDLELKVKDIAVMLNCSTKTVGKRRKLWKQERGIL